MSSKARRPYLMGKESVGDFYKSDVRFLKEIVGRESEFEKPYEEEDYRKMHFDFPLPDWPPFPPLGPLPPIEGPVPRLTLCAITCYAPSDCDEPIWCHPSIWCGSDLECNLCSWVVEGATSGYSPHAMSRAWNWGIDIWIDSTLVEAGGEALIHVQMKDPCGNLCGEDVEVTCKVCPPDVAISWDTDLSAETIGQSSNVGVYVKDGLGPYSWSVGGTGFSMANGETTGVSNVLQADASACGTATITVTDFCEGTTTGYVRCTIGEWIIQDYANSSPNPNPEYCRGPSVGGGGCVGNYEYVSGKERWWIVNQACYGHEKGVADPCTGLSDIHWVAEHAYLDNWKEPPCGAPIPCASQTCSPPTFCGTRHCYLCLMIGNAYYYKWGCS